MAHPAARKGRLESVALGTPVNGRRAMSGEIDVPSVRLELISRPEAARLVRSMSSAAGDVLGFDPELQGHINTAVAEACNNAILHAYADVEDRAHALLRVLGAGGQDH